MLRSIRSKTLPFFVESEISFWIQKKRPKWHQNIPIIQLWRRCLVFQSNYKKPAPYRIISYNMNTLFSGCSMIFPLPFLCLTKRKNCGNPPWFNKWHLQTRRNWDALPGIFGMIGCMTATVGFSRNTKRWVFSNPMPMHFLFRTTSIWTLKNTLKIPESVVRNFFQLPSQKTWFFHAEFNSSNGPGPDEKKRS